MKNILAQAEQPVLARFAGGNVLLAFDYDGTLAPIIDDPDRAYMRPSTRDLLVEVTRLYPTIVISGRAQDDALRRLRGVGVFEVIGNHGLEPWHGTPSVIAAVRPWLAVMEQLAVRFEGVHLEDKIFSLAVHYRNAPEKKQARAAIMEAALALKGARIIGGKQVLNIVPEGAPHKGTALERERERLRCETAIYVGDDETDEDVFELDQPARLLTIRVGESRRTSASCYIPDQTSIDELLGALIELRRGQHERN